MDLASSKGRLDDLDKSRTLSVKDLCLDTQVSGSRQPGKVGWELSPRDGRGEPVGLMSHQSRNADGVVPQSPALQLSKAHLCELGGRGRNSCAVGPGYYFQLLLFNSNVVKYSSWLER